MDDIPARVAVLEQIARNTEATLGRIETQLERLEAREADDFRFLVRLQITLATATIVLTLAGFATLGSLMAHSFHWI